ncbi:hypothetical protein SAMN05216267_101938 [Actinacidiphila rubida]|uniref:Uncharacterized protein n=1 Tax=Actinacidiphila rubida TaxID=310780 RepID=A0A1H8MKF9_9ACTN|nr:hypothetical protein SAMN05216267_101938 [Actinacidiphila rubida]
MRRHRFEPAALVMGLVLIGLTVAFLLDAGQVWDLSDTRETVPVAGSGLALVAVTAVVTQAVRSVRGRRARRRRTAGGPGSFRDGAS